MANMVILICKGKAVAWSSCELKRASFTWIKQFLVANTGLCNHHFYLEQCLSFDQLIYPIICSNRLFEQIPSFSESEIHIFSSINLNLVPNIVSFDWRVDQKE